MNQNFGPGKNTANNTHADAVAADKAFQDELVRQFGKKAGDFRYRGDCHDESTSKACRAFKAAAKALNDVMRQVNAPEGDK